MEVSYIFRNHLFNSNWFNILCHNTMPTVDISQKPLLEKLPEALGEKSNGDNASDLLEVERVWVPPKLACFRLSRHRCTEAEA